MRPKYEKISSSPARHFFQLAGKIRVNSLVVLFFCLQKNSQLIKRLNNFSFLTTGIISKAKINVKTQRKVVSDSRKF